MKTKITALSTALTLWSIQATNAIAQVTDVNIGQPTTSSGTRLGINPNAKIGQLVSTALVIIFIIGALAVLVMLVWGAFQWITSGGNKESVDNARKRITAALIGLVLLALAFLITNLVSTILGVPITNLGSIPTLSNL